MERGEIVHRARAKQIINFKSLLYGKITPTDIDGLIDFGNKLFILIEIKYGDTPLKTGQRLAIERVVDTLARVKKAVGIVASHNVHNANEDIDCAECVVTEIRVNSGWKPWGNKQWTVKRMIDYCRKKYGIGQSS